MPASKNRVGARVRLLAESTPPHGKPDVSTGGHLDDENPATTPARDLREKYYGKPEIPIDGKTEDADNPAISPTSQTGQLDDDPVRGDEEDAFGASYLRPVLVVGGRV